MTKEQSVPIFMSGFLAGGVILSLLAATEIRDLRNQLVIERQAMSGVSIEVRSLHARFAGLTRHIAGLAQRWEDDIQNARGNTSRRRSAALPEPGTSTDE